MARRSTAVTCAMVSGSSRKSVLRLTSALFTEKSGFSVVAPTSVMIPRSTSASSTSCWLLLKRWISSRKRIVRCLLTSSRWDAPSTISRIRFTPTSAAFSDSK